MRGGEYYEAAESMLAVLDDDSWGGGLTLVDRFAARRTELETVAAVEADPTPVEHHVPARYAKLLDD